MIKLKNQQIKSVLWIDPFSVPGSFQKSIIIMTTIIIKYFFIKYFTYVFTKNFKDNQLIDEIQYGVLKKQFESHVVCGAIKVDGIIMLDCSPSIAMNRIKKRNRPEELSISLEYQEQLRDCYMKWFDDESALHFCGDPFIKTIDGNMSLDSVKEEFEKIIVNL